MDDPLELDAIRIRLDALELLLVKKLFCTPEEVSKAKEEAGEVYFEKWRKALGRP